MSGYTGTLTNPPTWNGSGKLGANSLTFNGSSNYITVGNQTNLNITGAITMSAWVMNPSSNAGWGGELISKNTTYNFGFGGSNQINPKLWFGFNNGGWRDFLGNTTTWTANQWYHVAVTEDSSMNIKLFVNGVLDGSFTTTYTRPSNSNSVLLGRHGDTGISQFYKGGMDDLGVWNEALDPKKIALINGLGLFSGVDLGSASIDNVLGVFSAGSGTAAAGSQTWGYKTGLGSTTVGATGGSVLGGNAYIVLDASGNGVGLVTVSEDIPEPATMALLGLAVTGLGGYIRRRRTA